jgi:hypothetical protein
MPISLIDTSHQELPFWSTDLAARAADFPLCRRDFLQGKSSPASQYAAYKTTASAVSVITTTRATVPTMISQPPACIAEILEGLLHAKATSVFQSSETINFFSFRLKSYQSAAGDRFL